MMRQMVETDGIGNVRHGATDHDASGTMDRLATNPILEGHRLVGRLISAHPSRRARTLRAAADALGSAWEYTNDSGVRAAELLRRSIRGGDQLVIGFARVALAAALSRSDQPQEAQHQLVLAGLDATGAASPELANLVTYERAFLAAVEQRRRGDAVG